MFRDVEVCLLIYQRYKRLPEILEQLKAQTIQTFKVNIWNNSGEKLDVSDFPKDRIMVINSEENVGSQVRFKLAKQTVGNPIILFDDDESLSPNFIEYHYNQYLKFGPDCILGYHTRIFKEERYWRSGRALYGQEVDYVAAKSMIFDRKIIDEEPLLQNISEPFVEVEDLYLCYLARMKHGMKMIKIDPASHTIVDGKDMYLRLLDYKEVAFKELRKMGWQLLSPNSSLKKQAFKNLVIAKEVFDKLKIPFCLMDGTLLGAYRDGDFILDDYDDIDIGFDAKYFDKAPLIFKEFEETGFKKLKQWDFRGRFEGGAVKRGGNHVDFFCIHKHRNGKEAYNLGRNFLPGNSKPYRACVYPIENFIKYGKIIFKGMEFNIPNKVESLLKIRYGDWKTPIRRSEGFHFLNREQNPNLTADYEI